MKATIVTAAVIFNNDKLLITQRKRGTNQELKWEFPGGKLEEGESPEECLVREIKEELGIDIEVRDSFDIVYHQYPSITILLLAYKCSFKCGELEAIECNDYRWINIEEIDKYQFAEADIPIVNKIISSTF